MKVEASIELLLPTVQYGNVKIACTVGLDSKVDAAKIKAAAKEGTFEDESDTGKILQACRDLALKELTDMKRAVDNLAADTYKIAFPKPQVPAK